MLALVMVVLGIAAMFMGLTALVTGELQFSQATKLQGSQARGVGIATILLGLLVIVATVLASIFIH